MLPVLCCMWWTQRLQGQQWRTGLPWVFVGGLLWSPGVLWLWHFLYSVGPHPVSSLHLYTIVVSRAFMAGVGSQAWDADSSRAPGLTSDFTEVHECLPWCSIVCATKTVHQFSCILLHILILWKRTPYINKLFSFHCNFYRDFRHTVLFLIKI